MSSVFCVLKEWKKNDEDEEREREVTDSLHDSYFLSVDVSIVATTPDHDQDVVGVWYLLSRKSQQIQFFGIVRG